MMNSMKVDPVRVVCHLDGNSMGTVIFDCDDAILEIFVRRSQGGNFQSSLMPCRDFFACGIRAERNSCRRRRKRPREQSMHA